MTILAGLCSWCKRYTSLADLTEVVDDIEIIDGVPIATSVDYVCSSCIAALPEITMDDLAALDDYPFDVPVGEDQLI